MAATAPRPRQHGPELLSVTIKYQRGSSAVTTYVKMTIIKVTLSYVAFRTGPIATNTICVESACEQPCQPNSRLGHCLGQDRPSFLLAKRKVKKKHTHDGYIFARVVKYIVYYLAKNVDFNRNAKGIYKSFINFICTKKDSYKVDESILSK